MGTHDPSVVMLHASASSARQWQPLATALAPRFRVHAIDLHGHGERAPWQGAHPLSLADDAALVAPLVLRERKVHLVGHSYGAAVALKVASLHPRHVRSVTVYEPVMFRWLEPRAPELADVRRLVDAIRRHLAFGSTFDAARVFIDFWSGEGTFRSMTPARRDAVAARMPTVAGHFDALLLEPLTLRDVARLCVPTMVLTGERTVRVMRRLDETLRAALGARHRQIADAGHMGPITHADAFNREVLEFVGQHARMAA